MDEEKITEEQLKQLKRDYPGRILVEEKLYLEQLGYMFSEHQRLRWEKKVEAIFAFIVGFFIGWVIAFLLLGGH